MNKKYLDPLVDILKIESISTQEENLSSMKEAREYLVKLFKSLDFKTQILKAKRHDAVFAERIIDKKLPTVLIYGHYDVQPSEPIEGWKTKPFVPTIKNNIIYARGATDNKGQFMVHVMAAKKLIENKKVKVNFKFLIEGEEEIGSISVQDLAKKYAKNLFRCDYLLVSDSEMYEKGQPSIDVSLKGLIYTEIFLEGAKQDLHSGQFGGVAENPANVLSHIIAKLKDEEGNILIPGFYKNVVNPTKKELRDYNSLKTSAKKIIDEGHTYGIGGGESKYSLNERRWSRPTLDVNGITAGYQGEGSKTIIPAKASAKISMRLVANQNPATIYKLFEKYVKTLVPKNMKFKIVNHSGALPYKAPTDNPVFGKMKKSLNDAFGKEPVFTGVGGSIGFIPVLSGALGVPCLMVGVGLPDDDLHAPNEHLSLTNYFKFIDAMADFYSKI